MRYLLSLTLSAVLSLAVYGQTPTTGLVNVHLPRDARLYVDEVYCPLPGPLRSFDTPPLDPGRRYFYTLTIEITVDGKPIRISRRVDVQAGRVTEVDFGDRAIIEMKAHSVPMPAPPPVEEVPATVPQAPPPLPALARAEGGFIVITRPVFEQYKIEEERVREVEGKPVKFLVTVTGVRSKPVTEQIDARNVKAIELPGTGISSAGLATVLAKERSVYLCYLDKLDAFYVRTLKPGTIVLFVPPSEPVKPPR